MDKMWNKVMVNSSKLETWDDFCHKAGMIADAIAERPLHIRLNRIEPDGQLSRGEDFFYKE